MSRPLSTGQGQSAWYGAEGKYFAIGLGILILLQLLGYGLTHLKYLPLVDSIRGWVIIGVHGIVWWSVLSAMMLCQYFKGARAWRAPILWVVPVMVLCEVGMALIWLPMGSSWNAVLRDWARMWPVPSNSTYSVAGMIYPWGLHHYFFESWGQIFLGSIFLVAMFCLTRFRRPGPRFACFCVAWMMILSSVVLRFLFDTFLYGHARWNWGKYLNSDWWEVWLEFEFPRVLTVLLSMMISWAVMIGMWWWRLKHGTLPIQRSTEALALDQS